MTRDQFIACARRRAVPVGVACVADSSVAGGVKAVLYTEFSLAFPEDDDDVPLLAILITSLGSTLPRIRQERTFSLSVLRAENVGFAGQIVDKTHPTSIIDHGGVLPSVAGADTVFYCSYRSDTLFDVNDYSLVLAEVFDVEEKTDEANPLLNHDDWYWRLDRIALGSARGKNPNPRILSRS